MNNPYLVGDRVKLWPGDDREPPEDLVRDHEYVVEAVVLDRVQIGGKLYFASRFMLIGDEHKDPAG